MVVVVTFEAVTGDGRQWGAGCVGKAVPGLVAAGRRQCDVVTVGGQRQQRGEVGGFVGGELLRDEFHAQGGDGELTGAVDVQLPAAVLGVLAVGGQDHRGGGAGAEGPHRLQ